MHIHLGWLRVLILHLTLEIYVIRAQSSTDSRKSTHFGGPGVDVMNQMLSYKPNHILHCNRDQNDTAETTEKLKSYAREFHMELLYVT